MSVMIKNNALKFIPSEFRNHFINNLQLINGEVTVSKKGRNLKFIIKKEDDEDEISATEDIVKLSPMEFSEALAESFSLNRNTIIN